MPSILIGPVLMIGAGVALFAAVCVWMSLAFRPSRVMPRRSAIGPPPVVTVLDGVVIPPRKGIEP